MKIRCVSRFEMAELKYIWDAGSTLKLQPNIISIHGSDQTSLFEQKQKNILTLQFDDIGHRDYLGNGWNASWIPFNAGHAFRIIDFLRKMDQTLPLVINCHAGISRSGAIGTFACKYFGLDYSDFSMENRHIIPNSFILKILETEAELQGSWKSWKANGN